VNRESERARPDYEAAGGEQTAVGGGGGGVAWRGCGCAMADSGAVAFPFKPGALLLRAELKAAAHGRSGGGPHVSAIEAAFASFRQVSTHKSR